MDSEIVEMLGKPIKGYERYYRILENGTVRNEWNNHILKPDKGGCICLHIKETRKTLSIARLIAINYLNMPDDKQHRAYRKDKNGGFELSNIAWK